jgi:hypothetical protein
MGVLLESTPRRQALQVAGTPNENVVKESVDSSVASGSVVRAVDFRSAVDD